MRHLDIQPKMVGREEDYNIGNTLNKALKIHEKFNLERTVEKIR